MSYLKLLELKQEPFSNSPDPEFFYESPQHLDCLHRLEISVRLMRGLNVVLGEVGAGKSTLCRLLLRNLNRDAQVRSHLLLDPHFSSPRAMLEVLHAMFLQEEAPAGLSEWQLKEAVKNHLFKAAVDEDVLVVLIIDEGQKISHECLEVLRELLNYETNNTKLLQIVIFAQTEFAEMIRKHPNVADRINEFTVLGPLTFWQTRAMIRHRMAKACTNTRQRDRFTLPGYLAVYRLSGGHPRKIIRLCHKAMLGCILRNRKKAGWALVHASSKDVTHLARPVRFALMYRAAAACFVLALALAGGAMLWSGDPASVPDLDAEARRGAEPGEAGTAPQPPVIQEEDARDLAVPPAGTGGLAAVGDAIRKPVIFSDSETSTPETANAVASTIMDSNVDQGAAQAVQEITTTETTPPSALPVPPALGAYTLARAMERDLLLQLVYGGVEDTLRQRFQALNPDTPTADPLPAGMEVQLPELSSVDASGPHAAYVVQITQDDSLQRTVDVLQGLKEQGLDVALAAQRREDAAWQFAILQGSVFQTEHAAAHALRTLPPLFQSGAKVVRDMHRKGEITLASFRKETAEVDAGKGMAAASRGDGEPALPTP